MTRCTRTPTRWLAVELVWQTRSPGRMYRIQHGGAVNAGSATVRSSPTQSTLGLMRADLLQLELGDDAVVLDPFAGSGSTLQLEPGHRCIGIELEANYCAAAAARLGRGFSRGRYPTHHVLCVGEGCVRRRMHTLAVCRECWRAESVSAPNVRGRGLLSPRRQLRHLQRHLELEAAAERRQLVRLRLNASLQPATALAVRQPYQLEQATRRPATQLLPGEPHAAERPPPRSARLAELVAPPPATNGCGDGRRRHSSDTSRHAAGCNPAREPAAAASDRRARPAAELENDSGRERSPGEPVTRPPLSLTLRRRPLSSPTDRRTSA